MVEIIYGDNSELVDLSGMSVADARRRYEARFNISGGAKARLNRRSLDRKQEREEILEENDILYFTEVSRFKQVLVGALVLAFAASASMFAFAYTSASTSITATGGNADFASVTANNTVAGYNVFGSFRGAIGAGNLFNLTPATAYTGDLEVSVYLTNLDNLSRTYGMFLIKLQLVDNTSANADLEGIVKPLTMNNGVVTFLCDNLTGGQEYYIETTGGIYRAFPWAFISGSIYGPTMYADVVQAG